jgi:hypothetical protein
MFNNHQMEEIRDIMIVEEIPVEPTKYLFCYGSNNSQQVSKRIESDTTLSFVNAYIQDYVRIFAGTSKRWKGGIVGLYPQRDFKTYGILVTITESQLIKMDEFEKGYERKTMIVNAQISEIVTELIEADVYWKTNTNFEYMPSSMYLCSIHKMLQERTGIHKHNIIVRGIINDELKEIGIWKSQYGLKMKL